MFKATTVDEKKFRKRAIYYVKRSKNKNFIEMRDKIGDDNLFIDALCICNKLYETSTPLTKNNIAMIIGNCTEQYKLKIFETLRRFHYIGYCSYKFNLCYHIVFPNGNRIRQTANSGIFVFVKFLRKET